MSRRHLLQQGLTIAIAGTTTSVWARPTNPSSDQDLRDLQTYDFLFPRIRIRSDGRTPDQWNVHPIADRYLLRALNQTIRCKTKEVHVRGRSRYGQPDEFDVVLDLEDRERLTRYPLIFMTGEGAFSLSPLQKKNLKTYIEQGGFVLMDDCVFNSTGEFFYRSAHRVLSELFGPTAVQPLKKSHEIFHNVFDLGEIGLPFMHGQRYGAHGIFIGDRLAVLLSPHDIHCGWADKRNMWFRRGGSLNRHSHKEALQMGVNIIMYALTH